MFMTKKRNSFVSNLLRAGAVLATAFGVQAQAQTIPAPLLFFDFEGSGDTVPDKTSLPGTSFVGEIDGDVFYSDAGEGAPDGASPQTAGRFEGGHLRVQDFNVPDYLHGTSYTLACWLKPDDAALSGGSFIFGQGNQGIHNGVRVHDSNGAVPALHTAHWGSDASAETELLADEWVHGVWTYDAESGLANIFLNGENDLSDFGQNPPNGGGVLIIGSRNNGEADNAFTGDIDELAIWDEVLTLAQIQALAAGTAPFDLSDSDEDDLPDGYEMAVAGNLDDLNGDGVNDSDGDGLTDLAEFEEHGTDPTKADSDGDTLEDGAELAGAGARPATDPFDDDTDGDGLSDAAETNTGTFVSNADTGTDPTKVDTDGDEFRDGVEITQGSDPTDEDSVPGAALPPPLVYFDFEGDEGDLGKDKSGNGYDADVIGGVELGEGAPKSSTPGQGGLFSIDQEGYLDVTGFDWFDLVHAGDDRDGDYTLSAFLKVEPGFLQGQRVIWGQGSEGVHNGVRNGGFLHTAHWGSDINAGTVLTEGEWVHGLWTYNGAEGLANIYLNGLNDLEDASQNPPNGSGNLVLGVRNGGQGGTNFVGALDDLAIWNEVLRQDQITLLANGASPIGVVAGDEDADDLPDDYERAITKTDANPEGNLTDLNGKAAGPGPGAGTGDFDGDGRTDLAEFSVPPITDPTDADSDDDTLSDGDELAGAGQRPATNPNRADTDGDDLSDGVEDNTGTFVNATMTGTDPTKRDTDEDEWDDGIETNLGFDPTSAASKPAEEGPVVYFDFEDEGDGTTVTDGSGFGNDGEIFGDVTFVEGGAPDGSTPGRSGRFSIEEDGRIEVESFNMNEDLRDFRNGDYTFACWLKVEPDFLDGQHVIWGQQNQGIHNGIRNGGFLHTAHWGADFNAGTVLDEDTWLHGVWTYDGTEDIANIYLNGELDLEAQPQRAPNGGGSLVIGTRNGGNDAGQGFVGNLDDMAIWRSVLSEERIKELAAGTSPIGAAPGPGFAITRVEYIRGADGAADQVMVTWRSKANATYAVDSATTLPDTANGWEEQADGWESQGDETSFTVEVPADAAELYVRVRLEG